MSAVAQASFWQMAVAMLEDMQKTQMVIDEVSYGIAIEACSRAEKAVISSDGCQGFPELLCFLTWKLSCPTPRDPQVYNGAIFARGGSCCYAQKELPIAAVSVQACWAKVAPYLG
ncbi:unnamed protein product [Symbiodinium necroappetens]|uniref:Uncharacterized protein n=2 Tax=Symbiodinium TaxID=2949 RepID=A0A812Y5R3_9DINO|nr:hypothetical protein AK812_SmicGene10418 [Symbiodinium microadriaticum]CAE7766029.1 unnamed protein product [Symbiodinium necroappetens]